MEFDNESGNSYFLSRWKRWRRGAEVNPLSSFSHCSCLLVQGGLVQDCFCQATCFFDYIRQLIKTGNLIPSIIADDIFYLMA
jgi:hypothetical protein